MDDLNERLQKLEDTVHSLQKEYTEMKEIIKELTECNKCEYCEYINTLYTCVDCSRRICRKCSIKNHTKSYSGEPICQIICNYCHKDY